MARVPKVRFRRTSAKALVNQLAGSEPAYPVYNFGNTIKFERPEVAGATLRWAPPPPTHLVDSAGEQFFTKRGQLLHIQED